MSSENTSDIQKRIYDFIVQYMRDEGMPPTNREIGSAMNIASTGHVDYHLSMLEKKGYITRESKKSRGIKLVEDPFGIPVMGVSQQVNHSKYLVIQLKRLKLVE